VAECTKVRAILALTVAHVIAEEVSTGSAGAVKGMPYPVEERTEHNVAAIREADVA